MIFYGYACIWAATAAVRCLYFYYNKKNIMYDQMSLQANHVLLSNANLYSLCGRKFSHFLLIVTEVVQQSARDYSNYVLLEM